METKTKLRQCPGCQQIVQAEVVKEDYCRHDIKRTFQCPTCNHHWDTSEEKEVQIPAKNLVPWWQRPDS